MGTFNKKLPVNETRFDTIPAEPGWFMFDWSGPAESHTLRKAPIVAWLVEAELYPSGEWEYITKPDGSTQSVWKLTGGQDSYMTATPVSPGGFNYEFDWALGPDGVVYKFTTGESWPDIRTFVNFIAGLEEEARIFEERKAARENAS